MGFLPFKFLPAYPNIPTHGDHLPILILFLPDLLAHAWKTDKSYRPTPPRSLFKAALARIGDIVSKVDVWMGTQPENGLLSVDNTTEFYRLWSALQFVRDTDNHFCSTSIACVPTLGPLARTRCTASQRRTTECRAGRSLVTVSCGAASLWCISLAKSNVSGCLTSATTSSTWRRLCRLPETRRMYVIPFTRALQVRTHSHLSTTQSTQYLISCRWRRK